MNEINDKLRQLKTKSNEEMNEVMDEEMRRKSSFDRFGDDLSELIVSYLTIEDKFRFQCLSKQWQRLVFNRQYVLKISFNVQDFGERFVLKKGRNNDVVYQSFESCLQKLKNLSEIENCFDLAFDSRSLHIIADNCHHLRRLSIGLKSDISDESIEYFGRKCG